MQVVAATLLSGASGCFAQILYRAQAFTGMRALNSVHSYSQGTRAAIIACAASCTVVPLWTHMITGPLASVASGWLGAVLQHRGIHDNTAIVSMHLSGGAIGLLAVGVFAQAVRPQRLSPAVLFRLLWSHGLCYGQI